MLFPFIKNEDEIFEIFEIAKGIFFVNTTNLVFDVEMSNP